MQFLNLFIDESGQANPKVTQSPCYILCGCLSTVEAREEMKIKADQIKFKYWGRTDVVWHSREIARGEGEFKILQDRKVRMAFERDLLQYLFRGSYHILATVIDKEQAKVQNWNELKVYDEVARAMIRNYLLVLLAKSECHGKLVIESATSQKDFSYHRQASLFLSQGLPSVEADFRQIQNVLTEIAFVTKRNNDIEEQVADLLTYAIRLKFTKTAPANKYEENLIKILERKLFRMHPNTGIKKKKFHQKIESFQILPSPELNKQKRS